MATKRVTHDVIWWALRSKKGVLETYVDIIRDMYRDSGSVVRTAVGDTKPSEFTRALSLVCFCSAWSWTCYPLTSGTYMLMYADDIALADSDSGRLVRRLTAWKESLENGGLKINAAKTEYLACNTTNAALVRIGEDTVAWNRSDTWDRCSTNPGTSIARSRPS